MTGFHVDVADGIAVVTIDRPKANALDAATSFALGEVFVGFEHDPGVRVAVITGAGERFFSAGWDLGAAGEGESFDADWGAGGFGGFPDLPGRRTPVIAAVNGMAVGGGFEIALAADLIVAADHAQFFLPEAGLGMLPDAGSVRLPRLLPPHIARELLLTGRRMGAEEAARWGLVNRVVPLADLLGAARDLAAAVAASAPLSIAAVLDIGRRTAHMDDIEAMQAIKDLPSYRAAIDSEDAEEGLAARAEGRPPAWKGR
ncbi:MAG: enoyl-CoA hydratase-related protein [Ilumatobacteraceae bacterium]|nr:enoyl-CoA hydratase/isomerase family protein [Ilumatobacter sp.]MCO5329015.1 enoyl-CoA hydratase-related protein [Ilumatobacteraceae bacterium]